MRLDEMPHEEALKVLEVAYKIGNYAYENIPEYRDPINLATKILQKSMRGDKNETR